jgi:hypothetical protein
MSESSLFLVYKNMSRGYEEYRNGHGTGPMIWGHLEQLYGLPRWVSDNKKLWALARDPKVPVHLRLCHAFTFDRAVTPVHNLLEMAEALELAHEDIVKGRENGWSHFADIANDLRAIHKKHNRYLVGLALNCTSVADVWTYRMKAKDGWNCYKYATDLTTEEE